MKPDGETEQTEKWVEVEEGVYERAAADLDLKKLITLDVHRAAVGPLEVDPPKQSARAERRKLVEIPANSVAVIKENGNAHQIAGPSEFLILEDAYFALFSAGQHVRDTRAAEIIMASQPYSTLFRFHGGGPAEFYEISGNLVRISAEAPLLCIGTHEPEKLVVFKDLLAWPYFGELTSNRPAYLLELAGASEYFTRFTVPKGYNGHIQLQECHIDKIVPAGKYILYRPAGRWQARIIDEIRSSVAVTITRHHGHLTSTYCCIIKFIIKKPTVYLETLGSSAVGPLHLFKPELLRAASLPFWQDTKPEQEKCNLRALQDTLKIDYVAVTGLKIIPVWSLPKPKARVTRKADPAETRGGA